MRQRRDELIGRRVRTRRLNISSGGPWEAKVRCSRAAATPDEVRRAAEDPDNFWVPGYGPDAAGLTIHYAFGRWIVVWRSLEEPEDDAAELRWTVLRVSPDPDGPLGLAFLEV